MVWQANPLVVGRSTAPSWCDAPPFPAGEGTSLAALVAGRLHAALQGQLADGAWEDLCADLERKSYRQAVAVCHGNRSRMARLLGVSRITVRDKLDRYDLFPKRGEGRRESGRQSLSTARSLCNSLDEARLTGAASLIPENNRSTP